MLNSVSSSRHLQKRLYTVFQEPKRSGKSRHAEPLLASHKMALNISQLEAQIVKPVFLDNKNGKYKVVSFYAKKARGLMCRFIIQNRLERVEQLKEFDLGGYWFDSASSTEKEFVFKRDINE